MPTQVTGKDSAGNGKLPIIKCDSCGAEILLVPDVKLMSKAIEAHVATHRQKNPTLAELEAERIRDSLIIKVFDKATSISKKAGK